MIGSFDPRGSLWRRWDPHIHTPDTLLSNRFRGNWDEYLNRIESATPMIKALGVTDYYVLDSYEAVREKKRQGRLANVDLIFPNIEMRYGIGTSSGSPINVHLLVSPNDEDHTAQIKRFLADIAYGAYNDTFRCTRDELIRLGRTHDNSIVDERVALAAGANQFKVFPDQLRSAFQSNNWARENILIAVAVGSKDGTSGIKDDASLASLRKEIERQAHLILSAQPKQRNFWLGRGPVSLEKLEREYDGVKPCIHGSDAHEIEKVGVPDQDRLCWIKGDVIFETLRQACLEPESRAYVGKEPPPGALASESIGVVSLSNAEWLRTPAIPLNPGLVGVIGARGSGKTALADIIAAGGLALAGHVTDRSFAYRAREFIGNSTAVLGWGDGDQTTAMIGPAAISDDHYPRVRYLSQQFVDRLCSSEGVNDELLAEIERVIFKAHPDVDTAGATDFADLLDARTAQARATRQGRKAQLVDTVRELSDQRQKWNALDGLKKQRQDRAQSIEKDKRERAALAGKGQSDRARQLEVIAGAVTKVRTSIATLQRQLTALANLEAEVNDTRASRSPQRLLQLKQTHADAGISDSDWDAFLLRFTGDVDAIIAATKEAVGRRISDLTGSPVTLWPATSPPPDKSYISNDVKDVSSLPLSIVQAEEARLRALTGIDAQNARAYARISQKITQDEASLAKLDREIETAARADERIRQLIDARGEIYGAIFNTLVDEESVLHALYQPLRTRLEEESGVLQKLSFSVRRRVDLEGWAARGEVYIDLRSGNIRGRGQLQEIAAKELLPAWEHGSSADVASAMAAFRAAHERDILAQAKVDRKDPGAYRRWAEEVSSWLYDTEHITLRYSIQYDGLEIERLSPGTRGIVLLLLYLAIDRDDDRPLVIDQPEENLDPKSIFDELVGRFRAAKQRRQIIVITHNANLVVNADADQVIVATCGPHRPGELPEITYRSGALENPEIRRSVCDILEGGEAAFKERARRLRVRL